MRPKVVQIYWDSQLGLIQTDKVDLILVDEISNYLLLLLTVEASDVQAHHCKFLQLFVLLLVPPWSMVLSAVLVLLLSLGRVLFCLPPTFLFHHEFDVPHLSVSTVHSSTFVFLPLLRSVDFLRQQLFL